jgi:hypothetical protein
LTIASMHDARGGLFEKNHPPATSPEWHSGDSVRGG